MADGKPLWSVRKLLEKYSCMGLPHFQRGHVWNTDLVALLLESLFFDTPCGSIVMWQPQNPVAEGVALPSAKQEKLEYLLVDGQQRLRSIYEAFKNGLSGLDEDEKEAPCEESTPPEPVWCLNLARIPELADVLPESTLLDRGLFMHTTDPRTKTKNPKFHYDLIPLEVFFNRPEEVEQWTLFSTEDNNAVLDKIRSARLVKKVQTMLERKFYVVVKTQKESENNLADMVELYNRINSGGLRVQAEEMAFATLLSIYPGTKDWLNDLFHKVHGESTVSDEGLIRDELLRRTQERLFGFSLFLRAFVQTAAYHFGYSLGSSALSFNVIQGSELKKSLKSQSDEKVKFLFDESTRIVCQTAELLRNGLYCDAFQFLPETGSLIPVFQLLLTYPDLLKEEEILYGDAQRKLAAFLGSIAKSVGK